MKQRKAIAQEHVERNVLDLLRDIRDGRLSGAALDLQERRQCVEYLTAESYPTPEVAKLLGCDVRTVQRDRAEIRRQNQIHRDPALAGEVAGFVRMQGESAMSALARIIRDPQTPPAVRVDAIKARFEVCARTVHILQNLGMLPSAASEVRAELTLRHEEPPPLADLAAQLAALEARARESGSVSRESARLLADLRAEIARAELTTSIESVTVALGTKETADGSASS